MPAAVGECSVARPRNVFARLPSYNPFVGTFHHAPSAGNRGAIYFSGDIVAMSELEERKKFRHNPLTGTFHSLPGYYDPLHRLSQFRNDDDLDQLSENDTDSVRSFVAVDLADGDDDDATASLRQPKSLSRMYSDSKFRDDLAEAPAPPRARRFSDSDADTFSYAAGPPQLSNVPPPAAVVSKPTKRESRFVASPEAIASKSADSIDATNQTRKLSPERAVAASPSRSRAKTLPHSKLQVLIGGAAPRDDEAALFNPRKSSSGSTQSTESESSPSSSTADLLVPIRARPDARRAIVASTELSEGFISTGKGVFRKVGLRHGNHERLGDHHHHHTRERRNSKPVSPSRTLAGGGCGVHWLNEHEDEHEWAEEYTQAAPRVPLNPFVARRLTDGDEIRIMAVHRHNAPRESVPHVINGGYDTDDEGGSHPKPYFIHENAVTEQYELWGADQLGDGSYAVVKPAIRRVNGKQVAIKQIHKRYLTTDEAKQAVEREIEIHLRLKHRNIVRLHEVYETEDFLYLVMAKAKRGNLKQLMQRKRRVPEALAAKLAQQIVRAVFFLHDSGVLHCDLKPENILLTDAKSTNQDSNDGNSPTGRRGSLPSRLDPHADVKVCELQVELCDFGLSVKVPDVRFYKLTGDVHKVPFTGLTGTPGYMAPELLQQQPYGKPVDMWSVGIVIYEMLMGYQPFYPPQACINEEPDFNPRAWKTISAQAKDLVMGLLERDPSKRLTAAAALSHGWFDTATFAI